MKKKLAFKLCIAIILSICVYETGNDGKEDYIMNNEAASYSTNSTIASVISHPSFKDYGRLMFPLESQYYSGNTLGNLSFTWYNNVDPNKTIEIINYFKQNTEKGNTIFYDIYSSKEKEEDPTKQNTGLFFFRGKSNEKFAICNAGGGFTYVAAMHDSFPQALEISKKGYNAFALIYRPEAQTACEDLARAITFIFQNAEQLKVNTEEYSLWGGSAGGRMAAWLGTYGSAAFGGDNLPRPSAIITQYTGLNEFSKNDPPTYACVGDKDGIAYWKRMQERLNRLNSLGVDTEFHVYEGLRHGFGLGTGTVAEGWINDAVAFWEKQMKE